jgi:hypothetical protein
MFFLNLDLRGLLDLADDLKPRVDAALQQAAQELAVQTHSHIVEQAQSQLHSTREKYVDALSFQQVNDSTWLISLDASAMWIEEGMPAHSMLENLLKSPKAKTARDGSRFLVVPFQQNKGPSSSTPAQQDLTKTVKAELKRRNIPYGKLEKDSQGNVKTGTLHSFNISDRPTKTHQGPGQGHGPVGAVRQGIGGTPFLHGVRVIQRAAKGKDGKTSYSRNIMTFRVASSRHAGTGRWQHPGLAAKNFFEAASDYAEEQWRTKILPQVEEELAKRL